MSVIAAVHGACLGGDTQIAMGADVLLARPDVKLCLIEMRWGFTPDTSGTQVLPRLVGRGAAAESAQLDEGLAMERHSMQTIVGSPGRRAVAEAALAKLRG